MDGLVAEALAARRAVAEKDLRDALRLDASRLRREEVEARLRARPHFLAAFPASALVQLRAELDAAGPRLADEAWTKLTDLRAWFGAEGGTDADEAWTATERAWSNGTDREAAAVARARAVRRSRAGAAAGVRLPRRPRRRRAGAPLDLEAAYTVEYRPSPQLEWAWRRLRALDGARNALADGGAPGFEVAFHVPEALPGP